MHSIDPMVIPIVGISLPVILVPVILGLKHARLEREMEHAERMKALELGRTRPQDEPWWSPARICVAIGAGVPVSAFAFALLASTAVGYESGVWFAASTVGVAGVVCGSLLAVKHFNQQAQARDRIAAKPPVDADAFDFAGRRG